jgi:hypothetical protein
VDKLLMHGTIDQFKTAVNELLEEVPMNELETMLLDKFLSEPADCAPKVADLLGKVKKRLADHRRAQKKLSKVIPLFEKHEFWSTQPVMRINEPIG